MNREAHQVLGAAAGVTLGHLAGWPIGQVIVAGGVAVVTAGGPWSPDCDQCAVFKRRWRPLWRMYGRGMAALWPGRSPGGDPAQHRGITHWWGVPATWSLLTFAAELRWPGPWWWLVWALIVGWASHLLGDAVHGRTVHGQDGNGIPLAPYWRHAGLDVPGRTPNRGPWWRRSGWGLTGLKSDGWAARWVSVPLLVAVTAWQVAVEAAAARVGGG